MNTPDPYPMSGMKLSVEESDLQDRRAHGEPITQAMFNQAKARRIQAYWLSVGQPMPEDAAFFVRRWIGQNPADSLIGKGCI